jgi:Phytanoyl-CoA dioxygenase (PhyH)
VQQSNPLEDLRVEQPKSFHDYRGHEFRRAIQDKGFVSITGLFTDPEIEEARVRCHSILARAPLIPAPIKAELGVDPRRAGLFDTVQFNWLQRLDPRFNQLAIVRKVSKLGESILSADVRIPFISLICKAGRRGGWTPWHQDSAYDREVAKDNDLQALTVWISLQDVDTETGCLCYSEGSHRGGLRTHAPVANSCSVTTTLKTTDGAVTACPVPAGGLLVHDRFVLHSATPNHSNRDRLAVSMNVIKLDR